MAKKSTQNLKKKKKKNGQQGKKMIDLAMKEEETTEIKPESVMASKSAAEGEHDDTVKVLRYTMSHKFNTLRTLFLKRDASNALSVLVGSIPPFVSQHALQRLLECETNAEITNVNFRRTTDPNGDLNEGYRTASVLFATHAGVEELMNRCNSTPAPCLEIVTREPMITGLKKWCMDYRKNLKTREQLKDGVESYMKQYDDLEAKRKAGERRQRNEPDEEGWITVTKSSRKAVPEAVVVKNKTEITSRKRKKQGENLAFYKFQMSDKKMKAVDELQRQFTEDKKRLALAKAARKFRPG